MANFAKLDENNIVIAVNAVNNDILDQNNEENSGIEFLTEWSGGHSNWRQTSYNKNFRGHYAGIGFYYDSAFDAFIPPQPFPSWKLNYTTFDWEPPIALPEEIEGYKWLWSEPNQEWVKVVVND
jgi:hypothetical protein